MKKILTKIQQENENGARRAVIEDLFYDLHKSRRQVYKMNFIRGVFFGVGSVVGGTIVVALLVWLLTRLVDLPGGVGSFIQYVVDVVQRK